MEDIVIKTSETNKLLEKCRGEVDQSETATLKTCSDSEDQNDLEFGDDNSTEDDTDTEGLKTDCLEMLITLFNFTFILVLVILCGTILWGIIRRRELKSLDPVKDFAPISPNCNITEYVHESSRQLMCQDADSDHRYKCGCKDKYTYIFVAHQLTEIDSYYAGRDDDGYEFKSITRESYRKAHDCDSGDEEAILASPLFTPGESTTCYRPSTPGMKLGRFYNCGNDDCIKIFNPQDDIDEVSSSFYREPWVLICLGCSGFLLVVWPVLLCCVAVCDTALINVRRRRISTP